MFNTRRAAAGQAAKSEGLSPSAPKPAYRFVLWAILGVLLLMLTTFVIFGALGGSMVKSASPQARTATFSDLIS